VGPRCQREKGGRADARVGERRRQAGPRWQRGRGEYTRGGRAEEGSGPGVVGPRGEERGEGSGLLGRGPAQGEEGKKQAELRDGLGWVELPFSFLSFSSFLFLFYTQTIQANLFEFK
jgi:hypothetical protein